MNDQTLFLRPSGVLSYENCGYSYYLQYVLQIRTTTTSHSLAFGTAGHKGALPYVAAHALGETVDTVALFREAWTEQLDNNVVQFSTHSVDELTAIGVKLAQSFPAVWDRSGMRAVVVAGRPLVENRLRLPLGENVVLTGEPDIIATSIEDPGMGLIIPDVKFASGESFDGFANISDQLTAYNLLVHFRRNLLGLEGTPIAKVGFCEGLKKKDATWAEPQLAPARTEREMGEYVAKVQMTAALMRKGYFPKRSASGYNTPCAMCDFRNLCLKGDSSGLHSRLGPVDDLVNQPIGAVSSHTVDVKEAA